MECRKGVGPGPRTALEEPQSEPQDSSLPHRAQDQSHQTVAAATTVTTTAQREQPA